MTMWSNSFVKIVISTFLYTTIKKTSYHLCRLNIKNLQQQICVQQIQFCFVNLNTRVNFPIVKPKGRKIQYFNF